MKKVWMAVVLLAVSASAGAQNYTLHSESMKGQAQMSQVFNNFGCKGGNRSPQLLWTGIPEGTRSFAVTMYDPDAPTGSGWWHWIVFDIPAPVTELAENAGDVTNVLAPKGAIQSINDFGGYGYGGPCPPADGSIHAYIVTVYALRVSTLGLEKNSNPAMVGFSIHANTIAKASLVMYYQRQKE